MPAAKRPATAKPAAKPAVNKSAVAKKPAAKPKAAAASNGVAKVKATPGKVESKVGGTVKNEFANLKSQAGEKARDAANRGKDRAAEALDGIGKIIRDSASTIDEKVGAQYGDYARSAAESVEGFANKVDAKNLDDLMEETRQFVRKSPAVAIGAAAAIGFVLARVIRSGRDA
jgi:ElaB/YqjD/DUF883 family membrane-anchored ribosome-binding protein